MVFKLVRTDTEDPHKIQLLLGSHIIGRGKFLDCDDKRVSRNHGELEVSHDSVNIKALHQNPCFYIRKGMDETQILRYNTTVDLNNGDKFGLLPDKYWYEVLHCYDDGTQSPVYTQEECERDTNMLLENTDEEINPNTENVNGHVERSESPSLLGNNGNDLITQIYETNISPGNEKHTGSVLADNIQVKQELQCERSQGKRCHSSDDDISKKVKKDPDDIGESEVKQEPDDGERAGPSNEQRDNTDDQNKGNNKDNTTSPTKPAAALRERCYYGANCYRRNPQHKAQFSHPSDSDWGTGECPWGAACSRRAPRHWAAHSHPPGAQPPAPRPLPAGKRRKQKRNSSDEDTPAQDLIVTGKRQRKTIDLPKWSDSESEPDPYQTDDSDEWQPTGTETESQLYTQDVD